MTTPLVFVSVWHSSSFCVLVFDWRCNQIALYFSARCVYLTPDHTLCVSCLYVCVCVCEHLVLLSSALCVYLTLDFIFCVSCIYVCAFVYCVCKHLVLISSALCVYLTCDRLFFIVCENIIDCPTQLICTWIFICFCLCSMTKLKEHSREIC